MTNALNNHHIVERGRNLNSDFNMIASALIRKGTTYVKMTKCSKDYKPTIETFLKSLKELHNPNTLKRLNDVVKAKKKFEQRE
jgi:hypothetical protein